MNVKYDESLKVDRKTEVYILLSGPIRRGLRLVSNLHRMDSVSNFLRRRSRR